MHYKNGREAKAGDLVLSLTEKKVGVLHSTNAQAQTCNGRLALTSVNDPYVTIGECVCVDDIKGLVAEGGDGAKPA